MRGVTAAGGYWVEISPFEGNPTRRLTYCSEPLSNGQMAIKLFVFEGYEHRRKLLWPRYRLLEETVVALGQEDKAMPLLISQVLSRARKGRSWRDAFENLGLVDKGKVA